VETKLHTKRRKIRKLARKTVAQ